MSQYFQNLQKIYYDFDIGGINQLTIIKDISFNARINKELTDRISLNEQYIIEDGDTPESISKKFYGTPDYYWLIMLLNNRFHHIDDFPMSSSLLEDYAIEKYDGNLSGVHHYVDKYGFEILSQAKFPDLDQPLVRSIVASESVHGSGTNKIFSTVSNQFAFINEDTDGIWQISGINLNPNNIIYINAVVNLNELQIAETATTGSEFLATFHRWIDPMKNARAVTNIEFEVKENELKRKINIMHPTYIPEVSSILNDLSNQ